MFNFMKKADEAAATTSTQPAFKDVRPQWKALANERKLDSADMAALCIYRSMIKGEGKEGAISRLRKSFKPITNPIKLENGAYPFGSLASALWRIKYSTFIGWLDVDTQTALLAIAKDINAMGKEIK